MMPPRKAKVTKSAAPKSTSILSYFSASAVKSQPLWKVCDQSTSSQNKNNNNRAGSKRKSNNNHQFSSPKRKPTHDTAETIVISSEDEDFQNHETACQKHLKLPKKSIEVRNEITSFQKISKSADEKPHKEKSHGNFSTKTAPAIDSMDVSPERTMEIEMNAEKAHSFFQKRVKIGPKVGTSMDESSKATANDIVGAVSDKTEKIAEETHSFFQKNVKNHTKILETPEHTQNDNHPQRLKIEPNDHNAKNTSTKSQNSEDETPQEKIAYYLLNFRQILDTVLSNDDDRSLFEGSDDIIWLNKFNDLPLPEQKLYVRLYHRKLAWLRLEQVNYPNIAGDIQKVLNGLASEGFLLTFDSSDNQLDVGEVLKMLPAPSLKELAKSCHINATGRSKGQMISDLEEMCKNQRSVIGGFFGKKTQKKGAVKIGLQNTVMKRACKLLGPCLKVAAYPRTVFNRVLLVFDVTRGIDDESECTLTGSQNALGQGRHLQLSAILMAGMGKVSYPTCKVDRPTPIFRTRSDLLHYETAFQFQADVLACVEAGQWKEASDLCSAADNVRTDMEKNDPGSCGHSRNLPVFLRCFTAQWTYARLRSLEVEVLQRLKNYRKAVNILRELLDQRTYCTSRRGHWWERLALNLDQHLKDQKASLDTIYDSLQDSDVRVGHKLALAQRVNKILSSRAAKRSKELGQMYEEKLQPIIDRLEIKEAPVAEITGRLLPSEMQTGKSRFIATELDETDSESTLLCSVEELALSHYRGLGYDFGIHGEGGTFSTLFCIFMWDIIFMPGISDVFRTSYQTHPLDFHTDEFYLRRQTEIEKRLQLISDMDENDTASGEGTNRNPNEGDGEIDELENLSAIDLMSMTWDLEYGKACASLNWERFASLEEAQGLVRCIGGKVLAGIFRRFAKDLRHTRSGLPDLVVWNPESRIYKMVEVKGPGDRLSTNQKLWLDELIRLNANVEVCKVIAVGGKRLSRDVYE